MESSGFSSCGILREASSSVELLLTFTKKDSKTLKLLIFKTIARNKDKMVILNDKKNQPKSNLHNHLIAKSQQLNHL